MPATDPLAPKIALVTGGAIRVGAQIVRALHARGLHVYFTFHSSQSAATSLAAELSAVGPPVTAIQADLFEPVAAAQAITQSLAQHPHLSVLVHSASRFPRARLADTDQRLIDQLMAIHVTSPLLITQALADKLRSAGGCVVNLLDAMVDRPGRSYLAYAASKAALANLTLSLARELAPHARCNAVAPGAVLWPDNTPEAGKARYLSRVPLARQGTPEEVAAAVCFLALDAPYTTGVTLPVDGGRHAV
jgi:pteridine reductase